ncbi:hypothetical protein B5X24_HaOG207883 [Helicoverpa armigera]|uniref:FLYWCH-type domain-containing protein n=1 Tax=Helicoverpa armigera TaxID=29058 RepID=A0A2W1BNG1_HELAM|nr:hypothetical protein B5X24_HaOG207883 [Helicoverpa armigera]
MEVRGGHNARAFAQKLAASRHYVSLQCPSIITTDGLHNITQIRGIHNHPEPVIIQTPTGIIHKHTKKKRGPVLIKSKRKGQYVLLYNSYTYSRSAKSKKGTVWKCTLSKAEECKARMTTDDFLNVVAKKDKHSHPPPEQKDKPKHVYFST